MKSTTRTLAGTIATAMLALTAAVFSTSALAAGDAGAGANKAETCMGCHNVQSYFNVYPTYRVPRVWGQHASYLEAALQAYKSGQREHATMQAQAANLSTQDIQDIAAYFAASGPDASDNIVGQAPESAATCAACHSANGISTDSQFPILAGLPESYLVNVLKSYKAGCGDDDNVENGRCNAIMGGQVAGLSKDDIKALAAFYSAQSGVKGAKPE